MSVKLNTRQVGNVSVIDVAGRITLGEGSAALRETLRDMVAKNQNKILLNLADVTYIDSSGIGELVSGYTTVTNTGGQLKLLNLNKRVKDLLADHETLHGFRSEGRRSGRHSQLLLGTAGPACADCLRSCAQAGQACATHFL